MTNSKNSKNSISNSKSFNTISKSPFKIPNRSKNADQNQSSSAIEVLGHGNYKTGSKRSISMAEGLEKSGDGDLGCTTSTYKSQIITRGSAEKIRRKCLSSYDLRSTQNSQSINNSQSTSSSKHFGSSISLAKATNKVVKTCKKLKRSITFNSKKGVRSSQSTQSTQSSSASASSTSTLKLSISSCSQTTITNISENLSRTTSSPFKEKECSKSDSNLLKIDEELSKSASSLSISQVTVRARVQPGLTETSEHRTRTLSKSSNFKRSDSIRISNKSNQSIHSTISSKSLPNPLPKLEANVLKIFEKISHNFTVNKKAFRTFQVLNNPTPYQMINITKKQTFYFFEIFNDRYVQKFHEHDTCYLLSDKYLNAGCFSLLVRANIKPEFYRSMYFLFLYIVTEREEESHHKIHLVGWILDDPMLIGEFYVNEQEVDAIPDGLDPKFSAKSLAIHDTPIDQKFKIINEIRFHVIRYLLNFNIYSSLKNINNFVDHCYTNHWIWTRCRSSCHSGTQHTVDDLITYHKNELNWIMYNHGNQSQAFICDLEKCKTGEFGRRFGVRKVPVYSVLENPFEHDEPPICAEPEKFKTPEKEQISSCIETGTIKSQTGKRIRSSSLLSFDDSGLSSISSTEARSQTQQWSHHLTCQTSIQPSISKRPKLSPSLSSDCLPAFHSVCTANKTKNVTILSPIFEQNLDCCELESSKIKLSSPDFDEKDRKLEGQLKKFVEEV